jgi:hypothetical protein
MGLDFWIVGLFSTAWPLTLEAVANTNGMAKRIIGARHDDTILKIIDLDFLLSIFNSFVLLGRATGGRDKIGSVSGARYAIADDCIHKFRDRHAFLDPDC